MPIISVLLPVYEGEEFLTEAIASILNQTFQDFELIIINDGSRDRSGDIAQSYSDPRIVYLENEKNSGLAHSLNRGLKTARASYIARMDADDISLPTRFEKQIAYLKLHPEVGVLGTAVQYIDQDGRFLGKCRFPESHQLIRWSLCFRNPIVHPSVMIRKTVLEKNGGYPTEFIIPEDYYLWSQLLDQTIFANLPDVLMIYRVHANSLSSRLKEENTNNRIAISRKIITAYLGDEVPLEVVRRLWDPASADGSEVIQAYELVERILRAGLACSGLMPGDRTYLRSYSARQLVKLAFHNLGYLQCWRVLTSSFAYDPLVLARVLYVWGRQLLFPRGHFIKRC